MLLVFGSAKLLAECFERMGQPGIVGEILAGVIIGPPVLDWIAPNEVLIALAELGVMFLLFRVGLKVRASELMRVGGTALLVATLGVVLPFAMGAAILRWFGASLIEAIFVGAAMVATSVGITAQVLASKGLLAQRPAASSSAAAVIDDVLGLIVLAVVSSMAEGHVDILKLSMTALAAIAFTLVVAKWGTRTMARVVPKVQERFRTGEVQFNFALLLMFGLALLATYVGVAAIIGAFLAGMALAESTSRRVEDLVHGVTELLLPFFLAGIGMHLDLGPFRSRTTLASGLDYRRRRRSFETDRLRPWGTLARPCGCHPRGMRHGSPRRSGYGGRADRPRDRRYSIERLRRRSADGGAHDGNCAPAAVVELQKRLRRSARRRVQARMIRNLRSRDDHGSRDVRAGFCPRHHEAVHRTRSPKPASRKRLHVSVHRIHNPSRRRHQDEDLRSTGGLWPALYPADREERPAVAGIRAAEAGDPPAEGNGKTEARIGRSKQQASTANSKNSRPKRDGSSPRIRVPSTSASPVRRMSAANQPG